MKYVLPDLPYGYDQLEPFIDERTLRVHHLGHHKTYVDKLNQALEPFPQLQLKVEDLLSRLESLPSELRTDVENNGGGHANHTLFWTILAPAQSRSRTLPPQEDHPSAGFLRSLCKDFGSFNNFKDRFTDLAVRHFSNGWAWLCAEGAGELSLFTTKDHESPLTRGATPLLVIDLWEHAYYLNYQNRRAQYVDAFWNVVNWTEVCLRWDDFCRDGSTNREWRVAV